MEKEHGKRCQLRAWNQGAANCGCCWRRAHSFSFELGEDEIKMFEAGSMIKSVKQIRLAAVLDAEHCWSGEYCERTELLKQRNYSVLRALNIDFTHYRYPIYNLQHIITGVSFYYIVKVTT